MKLDKLSVAELIKLQGDVEVEIRERRKQDLRDAKAAAEKAAAEFGFSLTDLVNSPKASQKVKSNAKYRNPENPDQTWTGRGRKPKWINEALAAGADITALEVRLERP